MKTSSTISAKTAFATGVRVVRTSTQACRRAGQGEARPELGPNDHAVQAIWLSDISARIETVSTEMSDLAAATTPIGQEPKTCCADAQAPRTDLPPEPRLDLPAPDVSDATALAALLGDRTRATIMRMLADGPMCVCEMAAALGEKQNNVSMHLARLRDAGLVRAVRHPGDARWMFYERDAEQCADAAGLIAELLR
jgi:ArsR family transcriptional regulator